MTTKELIKSEIDNMSDEDLDELYRLIKEFTRSKTRNGKPSLMSRLRETEIKAPEDFAINHDLYLSGDRHE